MWRTPDKLLTYFLRGEFRYLSPFAELKRDHFCCHSPSRPFFVRNSIFNFFSKTREKKQKSCDFFYWQNVFFAPLKWSQTQLCFKMKYYHRFLYLCVYGEKCLKNLPRVSTFSSVKRPLFFSWTLRVCSIFNSKQQNNFTCDNKVRVMNNRKSSDKMNFFLSTTIYIESLILNIF